MKSRVVIEILEPRTLLSVVPTQLAGFAAAGIAQGGLVVDSQGDIFGTTSDGSLYEWNTDSNGIQPIAAAGAAADLTIDPAGDVFGVASTGGASGDGAIFELAAGGGSLVDLASSTASGTQLGDGVVRDAAGNFFVLAEVAGSSTAATTAGNAAILEMSAQNGVLSTLAAFPAGAAPTGRLAIDSAGDLFAATQAGGINNLGAIYELPADNRSAIQLVASFGSSDPNPQGDLIADANGDVFGTTFNGSTTGTSISTVFALRSGNSIPSTLYTDINISGSHIQPGVTRDAAGDLFGAVANTNSASTIFEIPHRGGSFGSAETIAALPRINSSSGNANNANGSFAIDASGNLFGTTTDTAKGPGNADDTLFEIPQVTSSSTASRIQIQSQPASASIGNEISPISVDLLDSNGNLVAIGSSSGISINNPTITVQLKSGPAGATLGGTLTQHISGGVASFSDLTINQIGRYTLSFSLSSPQLKTVSKSFKIVPSSTPTAQSHLVIGSIPTTVIAGAKVPITVSIENDSNQISTTARGKVTLTIGDSGGGGGAGGRGAHQPVSASLKNGVAVFRSVSIDQAGPQNVSAASPGVTGAISPTFTVLSAPAKLIQLTQQAMLDTTVGALFSVDLQLFDRFGNLATADNSNITLTLTGRNTDALHGVLGENVSGGAADFSGLSIFFPGNYKILATDQADGLHVSTSTFRVLAAT